MSELICIMCPNGCHLNADLTDDGLVVKGSRCVRGETYAYDELTHPSRTVTAVVATTSATYPSAPVKTVAPVARAEIPGLLERLRSLRVALPVRRGEAVSPGSWGEGIQVVFTRSLPPDKGDKS